MERYLCPPCGHTVSVRPAHRLPYRPLEVERLQGAFDPPPEPIEAGCLQRAWNRFLTRVKVLPDAFGQILPAELHIPSNFGKRCGVPWVRRRTCCGFWPSTASARC